MLHFCLVLFLSSCALNAWQNFCIFHFAKMIGGGQGLRTAWYFIVKHSQSDEVKFFFLLESICQFESLSLVIEEQKRKA